jgi:hypothetical protein
MHLCAPAAERLASAGSLAVIFVYRALVYSVRGEAAAEPNLIPFSIGCFLPVKEFVRSVSGCIDAPPRRPTATADYICP